VIESAAAVEAAELAAGPRTLRSGVPKPLSTRLAVGSSQSTALEAVELGECTAGSVDVVLFAFSSLTSVEVILEAGIDGENFVPVSSTVLTGAGFARFRFRRIAMPLLRLYISAAGSAGGVGILATTVNGSKN